jgi:hypothetical protein
MGDPTLHAIAKGLTERQRAYVLLLADGGAWTHAQAALALGLSSPRRARGPWSGPMNPAQRLIGTVIGLDRKGLVRHARRDDGLSGTAYTLSDLGRQVVAELRG